MPLTFAQAGQINAVKRIGGKEEVRRFLNSLGFTEGSEVMLVSKPGQRHRQGEGVPCGHQ